MKGLIVALMMVSGAVVSGAVVSGTASAETIALGTDECGILKQCINIPNDAGNTISLYGAPGYPYFYVYIDDVYYVSTVASGTQMVNVSMQSLVFPDPTNPSTKHFTGSYLTISGTFTSYRTCIHSGRGQTCSTHWALIGGTIVL